MTISRAMMVALKPRDVAFHDLGYPVGEKVHHVGVPGAVGGDRPLPCGRVGTSVTWMRSTLVPAGAHVASCVVGESMVIVGRAGSNPARA
ncbi:hypothetical protein [Nocardia brasiliensis]|uniref:hypothetical protein n=1 Tax=Nocardia brasiliensis TaxID=37326 RepID=UPI0011B20914|nr:hypothetical protein [Nocardia brasiliensis]